jgi:regulator of ribosome biosynthesis
MIVSEETLEERVRHLRKIIEVAEALQAETLKNFHGCVAVMTGLGITAVSRLKKTWAALEAQHPATLVTYRQVLQPLADPGNGIYSNVLDRVTGPDAVSAPCVPFIGSFLTAIERAKSSAKGGAQEGDAMEAAARHQGVIVCDSVMGCVGWCV